MRNLKKILALVLVLVMAMSFASAASFSDVEGNEAIEVMAGIGVINGYEDGTYAPEKILTREEAMKIVAYLDLTADVAETLPTDGGIFTDVPAGKWSAGYIAYAYTKGIVDGNGDGTFGPADKLTGYAFAKMILNVLGIEGEYTGLLWKTNVSNALLANKELLAGLEKVDLNAEMSRANAAQLAFNALWYYAGTQVTATGEYYIEIIGNDTAADPSEDLSSGLIGPSDAIAEDVIYNALEKLALDTYSSRLEAIMTVSSACDAVFAKHYTVNEGYKFDYSETLAAKHDVRPYTTVSAFGVETTGHKSISVDKYGKPVAVYTSTTEEPTIEYDYDGVKIADLYADLGLEKTAEIEYWNNGVAGTLKVTKTDKTVIGGQGVDVAVYGTGKNAKLVVVETSLLGQVTKVVAAVEADEAKGIEAADAYVVLNDGSTFVTDAYAEGDVILCTKANGVVVEDWAAEIVNGKVEKRASTYVVVNGEKYMVAKTTGTLTYGEKPFDNAYDYYVSNGVVYGSGAEYQFQTAPSVVIPDEYVYVTEVAYKYVNTTAVEDNSLFGSSSEAQLSFVAQAKYIDLTGAEHVVDLVVKNVTKKGDAAYSFSYDNVKGGDDKVVTLDETDANGKVVPVKAGHWAAIKDGEFVAIEAEAGAYTQTVIEIVAGSKTLGTKPALITNKTALKTVNAVDHTVTATYGSKIEIEKSYELGTSAFIPVTHSILVFTENNGKVITEMYVMDFTAKEEESVVDTAKYAYVVAVGEEIKDGEWECTVFVGGEVKAMTTTAAIEAGYVYELTLTDGVITAGSLVTLGSTGVVTLVYDELFELTTTEDDAETPDVDETVTEWVYFGKDCIVYNLADYTKDVVELGDEIVVVASDATAGGAILIYIVG